MSRCTDRECTRCRASEGVGDLTDPVGATYWIDSRGGWLRKYGVDLVPKSREWTDSGGPWGYQVHEEHFFKFNVPILGG